MTLRFRVSILTQKSILKTGLGLPNPIKLNPNPSRYNNILPTCDTQMILKSIIVTLLFINLAVVTHSEVVTLDDSNFTTFLETHPYVLVEFYAPWCGHCKALAPEYQKLGELAQGKEYVIAQVDATVAEKTSAAYEVEGYPTIKFLAEGFPIDYKEERTAEDMQEWLDSFFTSKISTLTQAQLKEKIGSEDFLLVQGASSEQLKLLEVANFVDKAVPYYSLPEGENRITLYLKKDSKILDFTGNLSVKEITTWSLKYSLPAVVPLNGEQQTRSVFENEEKLPAFLLYRAGGDFSDEAFGRLEALCEGNKATYRCAYVDGTSALYNGVARYLKVTEPVSVLAYIKYGLKEGYKFPNPNELTAESITQFLEEVKEGKIPKFIDTQKDKKQKQVKYLNVLKLTSETYNSTLSSNKYVFIEYYSPNCGHCVRFAPEYEKLATKVKQQNLPYVIAAVDLVAESQVSDWVSIQGYPTLRFFVNGRAVEYSGEREAEEILKWIQEAIGVKLVSAGSLEEVKIPAVTITGVVSEESELHLLPILFKRYPIYLLPGDSFSLAVHTEKGVQTYTGSVQLDLLTAWLQDTTEPLIVGVVDQHPTKRLSKALDGKAPLLVVVKREETTSKHVLSIMEEYCQGKTLVCGYAGKQDQDYQSFSDWLGDKNQEKTVLVYIDTTEFKKTIFEGDLTTVTVGQIETFVEEAATKKVEDEKAAEETEEEAQQKPTQEVKEQSKEEASSSSEATAGTEEL